MRKDSKEGNAKATADSVKTDDEELKKRTTNECEARLLLSGRVCPANSVHFSWYHFLVAHRNRSDFCDCDAHRGPQKSLAISERRQNRGSLRGV